jgi:hypothetical protein
LNKKKVSTQSTIVNVVFTNSDLFWAKFTPSSKQKQFFYDEFAALLFFLESVNIFLEIPRSKMESRLT